MSSSRESFDALLDLDALIEPDRIHGSLYTDADLWQTELERIWYRTWVFVAHASEVPQAERLRAPGG